MLQRVLNNPIQHRHLFDFPPLARFVLCLTSSLCVGLTLLLRKCLRPVYRQTVQPLGKPTHPKLPICETTNEGFLPRSQPRRRLESTQHTDKRDDDGARTGVQSSIHRRSALPKRVRSGEDLLT